jgi:hypothetical protein
MEIRKRPPSHPLTGWAFVVLGCAGLCVNLGLYLWRCHARDIPVWPVSGEALEVLAAIMRWALPAAVLFVAGVLLPIQHLGNRPERRARLSRLVTATVLVVLGGYWVLRLNLVGFASLWQRREPLGDLILPAALLENRVWSGNIMLIFFVALLSLPVNTLVRRLLAREDLRPAPWPGWLLAGIWWVGLVAVLLVAGRP